jgi:hypothetical protein
LKTPNQKTPNYPTKIKLSRILKNSQFSGHFRRVLLNSSFTQYETTSRKKDDSCSCCFLHSGQVSGQRISRLWLCAQRFFYENPFHLKEIFFLCQINLPKFWRESNMLRTCLWIHTSTQTYCMFWHDFCERIKYFLWYFIFDIFLLFHTPEHLILFYSISDFILCKLGDSLTL